MKKKISGLVIILVLVFLVVGCSSETSTEKTEITMSAQNL